MQLERQMIGMAEEKKQGLRRDLDHEEMLVQKESRKKISTSDFESLAVVGRGAFGEVRLVRMPRKDEPVQIYALKTMKKDMMVLKNQVGHVRAEREALAKAENGNKWLTALHYSFVDDQNLYMVMEFLPGGDLMSLLIKEDTFSESVCRFFMAEAAHAISSVHALGYIHRDIKPDNMLLDARGHLKLTDLGLCKKVGEVSPMDDPDVILKMMKEQGLIAPIIGEAGVDDMNMPGAGKHRDSSDAMAMSIDDGGIDDGVEVGIGGPPPPGPQLRSAKARREVRGCNPMMLDLSFYMSDSLFRSFRWPIQRLVLPITLLPRYWPRKMALRVIPTRRQSIGGLSESSCLNAWLDTPPFMRKIP
jgi:serine/threonine protein kinase